MKPIIGILGRKFFDEREKISINVEIINAVINNGGIPIGVFSDANNIMEQLLILDGIILPGGSEIYEYDNQVMKIIYDLKLPCLGICLGMQTMVYYDNKENIKPIMKNINYHYQRNKPCFHQINIIENTYLSKIIKDSKIIVNSYHHDNVVILPSQFRVSTTSYPDQIIEAIELKSLDHFMLGIQFHPERDQVINDIFAFFIDRSIDYHGHHVVK